MKIAVVGATGLVGRVMVKLLEERKFPLDDLIPVASKNSIGQSIIFKDKRYSIVSIEEALKIKPDIALFSAGGSTSLEWAPKFAEKGTKVIDNSSAWRMDSNKKLIVPEINADALEQDDMIIANPNCSTIQMVVAIGPLHNKYNIKRLVISTYQSVSGTGKNAVDQLKNLVYSINTNPDSRRLMVSAWAPHELDAMALPPCHYAFQVYINNGVMDLMWMQRSADVFLGLPYDIVMYGLLLEMLAKGAGLKAGQLIGQLGDCHLYNNHLEQAQLFSERPKRALPKLILEEGIRISKKMDAHGKLIIPEKSEIKLNNYNPYAAIKAPLSVGK